MLRKKTHAGATESVKKFLFAVLCYLTFAVGADSFLRQHPAPLPLLEAPPWLAQAVSDKAHKAALHMHNAPLALAFLANLKRLEVSHLTAFQEAGLTHVLAISGGQVSPIIGFLLGSCAVFTKLFLRRHISSIRLWRIFSVLRPCLESTIAWSLSLVFGHTGALTRVALLTYAKRWPLTRWMAFFIYTRLCFLPISLATVVRVLLLIVLGLLFGNPRLNISFLLSALGASIATLGARLVANCDAPHNGGNTPFRIFFRMTQHSLRTSIVASLGVSLALAPLQNTGLARAVGANLLALPLVNLCITPLSLLALLCPSNTQAGRETLHFILSLLDWALGLLGNIAHAFSDPITQVNPFQASSRFFAQSTFVYLGCLLILLWALDDTLRAKAPWRMTQHEP